MMANKTADFSRENIQEISLLKRNDRTYSIKICNIYGEQIQMEGTDFGMSMKFDFSKHKICNYGSREIVTVSEPEKLNLGIELCLLPDTDISISKEI